MGSGDTGETVFAAGPWQTPGGETFVHRGTHICAEDVPEGHIRGQQHMKGKA